MADDPTSQAGPEGVPGAVSLLQAARAEANSSLQAAQADIKAARDTITSRTNDASGLEAEIDGIDRALAILAPT